MDNLTHSLLGAALAKTRLGQASPFAPAALVIAANLPDSENLVLAFCDHATNLVQHRSVTHAVLGVALLIPLFAGLVRLLERRFARTRPRGSFGGLLLGIGVAVASHPVLDWLNTYGVRPWLPFNDTWYHGDLVFIVDPWLWLLLGGAVCLAGPQRRFGSITLAVIALLTTALVLIESSAAPRVLAPAWLVAVTALAIGRWRGVGRRHGEAIVIGAFGLACAFVGFLGWAGRHAWKMSQPVIAARLGPGETFVGHTLSPQPADPLRWQIIAETERAIYRHEFSITRAPGGVVRLAKRLDDPLVRQVAETRLGRAWLVFARHPVAAVIRNGRGFRVFLMDARYGIFPARGFASLAIDVPQAGTAPGGL